MNLSVAQGPNSVQTPPGSGGAQLGADTESEVVADAEVDFAGSWVTSVPRRDGKDLVVPYPVTPLQTVRLIENGHLQFRLIASTREMPKPYCELRPSPSSSQSLQRYVQAVRDFELARMKVLRRDLEAEGVTFDSQGMMDLDKKQFTAGVWDNNDFGHADLLVRRGFFYAQQCTGKVAAHIGAAAGAVGSTVLNLPPPTEATIGSLKYSFFYPPYTLGDDATTQENNLTKVTRQCLDNALMTLAQSQQALESAGAYYEFFNKATKTMAPAAPIPYIPNPPPGMQINSR